jgi:hypothetical protein
VRVESGVECGNRCVGEEDGVGVCGRLLCELEVVVGWDVCGLRVCIGGVVF